MALGYTYSNNGEKGDYLGRQFLETLAAQIDPRYRINSLNGDGIDTNREWANAYNTFANDRADFRQTLLSPSGRYDAPYASANNAIERKRNDDLANNFTHYAIMQSFNPDPVIDNTKDLDLLKRAYAQNLFNKIVNR